MSLFSIVLVSGLAGAFIGAAIGRYIDPQRKTNTEREAHLKKAQEELTLYREQMNTHFTQTAIFIKTINDSCRNLQDHVEIDALKLTGLNLRESSSNSEQDTYPPSGQSVEAPRDYAPKSKDSLGTLSERYGLHDDYDDVERAARG